MRTLTPPLWGDVAWPGLPLADRVAFACRFLADDEVGMRVAFSRALRVFVTDAESESPCPDLLGACDNQLVNFLRTTYEGTVIAGSLDGLILSGVGPTSLRLCEGR